MTDSEKSEILARLYDGDAHIALELRAKVRDRMAVETDGTPVCRPDRRRTPRPRRCARYCPRTRCGREASRRTKAAAGRGRESPSVQTGLQSYGEVKASGVRSRPKSSAVTPQAMTRQRTFSWILRPLPKNAVRWLTSKSAYGLFGNDMRESNSSSCGWRRSDSLARCSGTVGGPRMTKMSTMSTL